MPSSGHKSSPLHMSLTLHLCCIICLSLVVHQVHVFDLAEGEVVQDKSHVGNSNVPYPYIVTNQATYLTIEAFSAIPTSVRNLSPITRCMPSFTQMPPPGRLTPLLSALFSRMASWHPSQLFARGRGELAICECNVLSANGALVSGLRCRPWNAQDLQ